METSIMKHAVVLMQTSSLDHLPPQPLHFEQSKLACWAIRGQFREFSSQQSRGLRGKVVRYIGHFVQLRLRAAIAGVIESQLMHS